MVLSHLHRFRISASFPTLKSKLSVMLVHYMPESDIYSLENGAKVLFFSLFLSFLGGFSGFPIKIVGFNQNNKERYVIFSPYMSI